MLSRGPWQKLKVGNLKRSLFWVNFWFLLSFVIGIFTFRVFRIFLSAVSAASQPPAIINYQGKLIDNTSLAVTTTVQMKVLLYDALTGGNIVYSASGTTATPLAFDITPLYGNFSVSLGDGSITNSLDPTIFQTYQNLYLEVRVGSDTLSPRKQISAAPFVYNAKYLDGVFATTTPTTTQYIPISDSQGNFTFNRVTTTQYNFSVTTTLPTTTVYGDLTAIQDAVAKAVGDNLGWIQNQQDSAKLQTAYNGSGFGSGATPSNFTMTSSQFSYFDGATFLNTTAPIYRRAIFDGRYIYYTPNGNRPASILVRYDTTQSFTATSSWSALNLADKLGASSWGSFGVSFDGRYAYFCNFADAGTAAVYRYDTKADFFSPSSWMIYNLNSVDSSFGTAFYSLFDGKFIYFGSLNASSSIIRYNTTQDFSTLSSWSSYTTRKVPTSTSYRAAGFDGRYMYILPYTGIGINSSGKLMRYDTTGVFSDDNAWDVIDESLINQYSVGQISATFDGRYEYFVSQFSLLSNTYSGQVTRYDTTGNFYATSSWSWFNTTPINGNSKGFLGSVYDGRYLYLVPNIISSGGNTRSGQITRYDTSQQFAATSSWSFYDMQTQYNNARGYQVGIFDGHYIYLVPSGSNDSSINAPFVRFSAYSGGLDTPNSITQIAKGQDFFIDANNKVGIGTTEPTSLLSLYGTNASTTGLTIGNGVVTSTFDHSLGLLIASTTANPVGVFKVDSYTGNTSVSGTLRVFGGVSGLGFTVSSTLTTNTIQFAFSGTTRGNGVVFDTNITIVSSTAALYSWRNNGFKLMSLSASGTLDVYGSISAMNTTLGTPGAPGDLAERVDVSPEQFNVLTPGDVMTLDLTKPDTYQKTSGNTNEPIMGVIALNPTLTLGNGKTIYTKVLTFLGRTPVKVSLQNGEIKAGDPLTLALNEPGKAMKQTSAGPIVGYALENYSGATEQNQGMVLTLVRPGWSSGQSSTVTDTTPDLPTQVMNALKQLGLNIVDGVVRLAKLVVDKVYAPNVTTQTLCLDNTCIQEKGLKELLDKHGLEVPAVDLNVSSTTTSTP